MASVTLRIKQAKLRHKRDKSFYSNVDNNDDDLSEDYSKKKYLMKYPPMNGLAWFGVSSAETQHRAYLGVRTKSSFNKNNNPYIWDKKQSNLSNFKHILDEIQTIRNENFDLLAPKSLKISQFSKPSQQLETDELTSTNALWIDKYSPTNFFELLTEDVGNFFPVLI